MSGTWIPATALFEEQPPPAWAVRAVPNPTRVVIDDKKWAAMMERVDGHEIMRDHPRDPGLS